MTLEDLTKMMNPVLRGWLGYYGRFRPSALVSALRNVNVALRMWVMRKYKRFKHRPQAAMAWLGRVAQTEPSFNSLAFFRTAMAEREEPYEPRGSRTVP